MQRVRRDERDHGGVEAPDEHRPAVREVVGGRARTASRRSGRRTAACRDPRRRSSSSISTIRPGVPLDDDGVVDGDVAGAADLDLERRQRHDLVLAGEHARRGPLSSSSPGIAVRNPTRPKLAPITGTPLPRNRVSARSIVPSPPSTTAMSGVAAGSPVAASTARQLDAGARPTARSRASAASTFSRHAVRDDRRALNRRHQRSTGRAPAGSSGVLGWTRWRTNSWFPFGPGKPESTTPATRASQPGAASATSRTHAPLHRRVADDTLPHLGAARLELRLHEHERLPAGRREPRAPAAAPSGPR